MKSSAASDVYKRQPTGGWGEVKNPLERFYRILGSAAKYAVCWTDAGNSGIVAGDAVEHGLKYCDVTAGRAGLQGIPV